MKKSVTFLFVICVMLSVGIASAVTITPVKNDTLSLSSSKGIVISAQADKNITIAAEKKATAKKATATRATKKTRR